MQWIRSSVLGYRARRDSRLERRLGIDTQTPVEDAEGAVAIVPDAVIYQPVDYPLLESYLAALDLADSDVVYDIGCGMGRILCLASMRGVKKCVGIEIGPRLAARARQNASRLRGGRSPIEVRTEDATKADYSDGSVFILFNPFGADTMRRFLDQLERSLAEHPRSIRLLYINPAHEAVFAERNWLRQLETRRSRWHRLTASYWANSAGL